MADHLTIGANSEHEYKVRLSIHGYEVDVLIDTGFIQVDCLVGVGLNNEDYAAVRSRLARERRVPNYSVGQEEPEMVRSGIARVSIVGLDNSEVETGVAEVGDNLLGVCYFHRLKN